MRQKRHSDGDLLSLREVLASVTVGESNAQGQQRMHCPLPGHDDSTASATLNWTNEIWYCSVCTPSGRDATFTGLMDALGITTQRQKVQDSEASQTLEQLAVTWHTRLKQRPDIIQYLHKERCLTQEMIDAAVLGWDESRQWITIPISDSDGKIVRFKARATNENGEFISAKIKYLFFPYKGETPPSIYPLPLIDKESPTVYVCAGELDSLVLRGHDLPALSVTKGEGFVPPELVELLSNRHIVICLDNDEKGRAMSWNLARMLHGNAQSIRIVHYPDGIKDTTDYFKAYTKESFDKLALGAVVYEPSSVDPTLGLYADRDCYLKSNKGTPQVLSSFVLMPQELLQPIQEGGEEVMQVAARTQKGGYYEMAVPRSAFNSRQSFLKRMTQTDMVWYGSDTMTQALPILLREGDVPKADYTSKLGFHTVRGRSSIVLPEHSYGAPIKWWNESPSQYFRFGVAQQADDAWAKENMKGIAEDILQVNDLTVTLPMLGWYNACLLAPFFRQEIHHFPSLVCVGTAGSGKTETSYYIMARMIGMNATPMSSVHRTFHSLRVTFSQSVSFPVILDEFTPSKFETDRTRFIYGALHLSYDGATDEIGSKDLKLRQYDFSAPISLLGEASHMLDVEALRERCIFVVFRAAELAHRDRGRFKRLMDADWGQYARHLYNFVLTIDLPKLLAAARKLSAQYRKLPERMYDNICITTAGWLMWQGFMAKHGIELPDTLWKGVFTEVMTQDPERACDHFIADLDAMAEDGTLEWGSHYSLKYEGDKPLVLWFHLNSCFAAWLQWRRRRGLGTSDVKTMRRQLTERCNKYVIGMDRVKRLKSEKPTVRTVMLDLEKFNDFYPEPLHKFAMPKLQEGEKVDEEDVQEEPTASNDDWAF